MNRFERALGILLHLQTGREVSAYDLAQHLGVSRRTIYRDMDVLSALGVPVYAERGHAGGFRLLEGYFLPPIMFSQGEAVALLLSLTLFRSLRAQPYSNDQQMAEKKLLAAMPQTLRAALAEAQKFIGFEEAPYDTFHPEREASAHFMASPSTEPQRQAEGKTTTDFLQAVLEGRSVFLRYCSPYKSEKEDQLIEPLGVFWDRDHWYLVGNPQKPEQQIRLWRADRVSSITLQGHTIMSYLDFDVRGLLGRHWLSAAMKQWSQETPVRIRLSRPQAERLQRDWYYQHAVFEPLSKNDVLMTFGEEDQNIVLELLRWLGPGAELIEPAAWRAALRAELAQMLAEHANVASQS